MFTATRRLLASGLKVGAAARRCLLAGVPRPRDLVEFGGICGGSAQAAFLPPGRQAPGSDPVSSPVRPLPARRRAE